MKYIITLWLCVSAIFTQAQAPKEGHAPTQREFQKMTVNRVLSLTSKLDSLYKYVHLGRPTVATTGDLVVMKNHIYDMVNSFFGKTQKKIDSLTNRLAKAELQIALLGGTKIQGAGRPWDHSWGPNDTLYHMELNAATLILPTDTAGHPITIDSLMKWLHGRGDAFWFKDPPDSDIFNPILRSTWDESIKPKFIVAAGYWPIEPPSGPFRDTLPWSLIDSNGYLIRPSFEPIYAPNRLPGERAWQPWDFEISDTITIFDDDNGDAVPDIHGVFNGIIDSSIHWLKDPTHQIKGSVTKITADTIRPDTLPSRYAVSQSVTCMMDNWEMVTEVNDSRLGLIYMHILKSTRKGLEMLKTTEYRAAVDATREIIKLSHDGREKWNKTDSL